MQLLINLKEFLKSFICNSNCCSNVDRNHDCKCEMCKNFLSNNLDKYNIDDEYLGLDDEGLYTQKKHNERKEINGD